MFPLLLLWLFLVPLAKAKPLSGIGFTAQLRECQATRQIVVDGSDVVGKLKNLQGEHLSILPSIQCC
jgi:hypothetical protein